MIIGFVESYGALLAVRFLLGIAETALLPGLAFWMSRFYRRNELVFRLSLYIVTAPLAGAFGGLLARVDDDLEFADFAGTRSSK